MRIGGVFIMRDLKRILELRFENHSQREIARMLKVSRNTVRDVFDAADAAGWYDGAGRHVASLEELRHPSIRHQFRRQDRHYVKQQ